MDRPTPPLRQKLRETASEAMLDAAEHCMIANGYDQTTMQQIAAEAGCAIGTFYLHFKNKEDILRAIFARHGKLIHEHVHQIYQRPIEPLEKIRLGMDSFLRDANNDKAFFRLLLQAVPFRYRHFLHFLDPQSQKDDETTKDLQVAALRQAQQLGHLRNDIPAELLQEFIIAVCVAGLESFVNTDPPLPVDQQIDTMWKLIAGGIGAKSNAD